MISSSVFFDSYFISFSLFNGPPILFSIYFMNDCNLISMPYISALGIKFGTTEKEKIFYEQYHRKNFDKKCQSF